MNASHSSIHVQGLSKCFRIYDKPSDRLKQSVFSHFGSIFGHSDRRFYREFWAMRDVSFNVRRGETVGIVGRNGSGKSTLLQMICGTLSPTHGSIKVDGRIAALLELGSGFNPEFTGRENVYLNGAVLGLTREEIEQRFDAIVDFADIGDFLDQPVKTYSSGMVVRLSFAVAINVDPQILVVDEALAVGDELFQRKCFARIQAIRDAGATILFVSHSGGTVVELCDRAILLDDGEMIAIGLPKQIIGKYQKLLYAPAEKRMAIREEIIASSSRTSENEHLTISLSPASTARITDEDGGSDEYHDEGLTPKSLIEYESIGARIESPEILTLSGKLVNCLRRGRAYRYRYRVRFERAASNVRFAMLIKTISGLELGGAVSQPTTGEGISLVQAGTSIVVEFRFTCDLNPGTYFLNAGVRGCVDQEETFLHRVLDLHMFRVLPVENDTATAWVDFSCAADFLVEDTVLP
jgi:lipopolysaccharide transport system ATP-binding protein